MPVLSLVNCRFRGSVSSKTARTTAVNLTVTSVAIVKQFPSMDLSVLVTSARFTVDVADGSVCSKLPVLSAVRLLLCGYGIDGSVCNKVVIVSLAISSVTIVKHQLCINLPLLSPIKPLLGGRNCLLCCL